MTRGICTRAPECETAEFKAIFERDILAVWQHDHGLWVNVQVRDYAVWQTWPTWFRQRLYQTIERTWGAGVLYRLRCNRSKALGTHPAFEPATMEARNAAMVPGSS